MANLNRLKVVLAEQQKTGKWLAEQIGKSNCTVSKWCSNSVQPDLKTLNDIANVLDIDVKDLIVAVINLKTIYYHGSKQERTQRTRDTHLVHYPCTPTKGLGCKRKYA